jgi:hypothetical protein
VVKAHAQGRITGSPGIKTYTATQVSPPGNFELELVIDKQAQVVSICPNANLEWLWKTA